VVEGVAELSNDQLIALGAKLETELALVRREFGSIVEEVARRQPALIKPGAKLGINAGVAVGGLALAPFTLSLSLALTVIGIGMTVWDGVEYGRDAAGFLQLRLRARRCRIRAAEIEAELRDIIALLNQRLAS